MKCKKCGNEIVPGNFSMINKDKIEWQCTICATWNELEAKYIPWAGEIPTMTFKEGILELHILYLEKFEGLTEGERTAYERYLISLGTPLYAVNCKMEEG